MPTLNLASTVRAVTRAFGPRLAYRGVTERVLLDGRPLDEQDLVRIRVAIEGDEDTVAAGTVSTALASPGWIGNMNALA
jgi:hypothetical protein